jgi:hypothetical protein
MLAAAGVALLGAGCSPEPAPTPPGLQPPADEPGSRGQLSVDLLADGSGEPGRPHRTVWVNGPGYAGMEDNDIRGFLDGTFKWGWNQPGQIHVRIGRRPDGASYAEHELFRVLHRWDDLVLPPGARVAEASLRLAVEGGPDHPLRVLLYRIRKDFEPGQGGTERDNVSPPVAGEAWWNDARYGELAWGLPGAGFASAAADADTDVQPVADGLYRPGDAAIVLEGPRLAAYVEEAATSGAPLLLLLKLSDHHEDAPGNMLYFYSGNFGDSGNEARRPRLEVAWSAQARAALLTESVTLEHGREFVGPRLPLEGPGWIQASFESDEGYDPPRIEIRGGSEFEAGRWQPLYGPTRVDWSWVQVRLRSVVNPVPIGEPFDASLRDTWVINGVPAAEQDVHWYFVGPSGQRHELEAEYDGDWRWSVRFVPRELGSWRYAWTSDFTGEPFVSPTGRFDVVGGDFAGLATALEWLVADATSAPEDSRRVLQLRLIRLEREVLRLATPATFRSEEGERLRGLLREARERISGRPVPVPEDIPLVGSPSHR